MRLLMTVQEAGVIGWVILALPALALPVLVVLCALSLFRLRVPAPLWFLAPVTALLVGHAGVAWGTSRVRDALSYADPAYKAALMAQGISESFTSRMLAQGVAFLLFAAVALLASIGNLRAGETPRWTPGHAAAPVVFALLAAVAGVGAGLTHSVGGFALAGLAPIGAVLLAITCLRLDDDDAHAVRMASARGVVGTALFAAGVSVFATQLTWGRIEAFGAVAHAAPSMKAALLAEAMGWYPWNLVPAIALLGLAGASALASVAHRLDPRALVGAGLTAAVLLVPGLVRLALDVWSASAMLAVMGPGAP